MGGPRGRRVGLRVERRAAQSLSRMPPTAKRALRKALARLGAEGPRPEGLDIKALDLPPETPRHFRLRIGPWRAVYTDAAGDVVVVRVFHRSDGYGWLERL